LNEKGGTVYSRVMKTTYLDLQVCRSASTNHKVNTYI